MYEVGKSGVQLIWKWKDFILYDECLLKTYTNVTRLVRRPKNCKYGMNYVVQTKKYGLLHIMICRTSKKQPFLTPRQLGEATEMLKKVSIWTIKKYLCSSGLRGRMASRKPFLTATHVRNRKKWCATSLNMDTGKWKDFIFSDECWLQTLLMLPFVRRPKNCKYGMNDVVQTKKYEGLHIMVWGAIKGNVSRILVRCPRRLNSTVYQDVLDAGLFQIYDSDFRTR